MRLLQRNRWRSVIRAEKPAISGKISGHDSKRLCGSIAEGTYAALFAIGSMVETAWQVRRKLAEKGIPTTVVNARFAMPLDKNCLRKLAESHPLLVTMEENVASGGFGEHVAAFLEEEALHTKVLRIAIPDCFVEHGSVGELKKHWDWMQIP